MLFGKEDATPPTSGNIEFDINPDQHCSGNVPQNGQELVKRIFVKVQTEQQYFSETCFLASIWRLYPEIKEFVEKRELQVISSGVSDLDTLFGYKGHKQLEKTLVALLSFLWILRNEPKKFVECQNESEQMTDDEFQDLYKYVTKVLKIEGKNLAAIKKDDEVLMGLEAMIVFIVIKDLIKNQKVLEEFRSNTGQHGLAHVDPDHVLYTVLEKHPKLLPSYEALKPKFRNMILLGMSTKFKLGQMVLGENVAGSLEPLVRLFEIEKVK
ncbi:hypothetical protein DdX_21737 [Ditylenchus destructor]|uniref:Uncharacterized protein n=1 Tax=Ditylenchus destructor TaxID=166010 RepID=A0AAD4MEJ1_9BILA|nr:hypothetical protein DdX_21737 [Ditylenchus destructor]